MLNVAFYLLVGNKLLQNVYSWHENVVNVWLQNPDLLQQKHLFIVTTKTIYPHKHLPPPY